MEDDVTAPSLAVHAVVWLRAWRAGMTSLDDVVAALTSAPMTGVEQVVWSGVGEPVGLTEGLSVLSGVSPDDIRLVLAVPGDVRGLPTSGEFTAAAVDAGEAVTAGGFGLVPCHRRHVSGSGDAWWTVTWSVYRLPSAPVVADEISVGEADQALSEALRDATASLVALDVAAWSPQLGRALSQIRAPQGRQLPPGFGNRARRLFDRATLLDSALRLADTDGFGGAVTAYEATARREALRPLAAACRQALRAACHSRLE